MQKDITLVAYMNMVNDKRGFWVEFTQIEQVRLLDTLRAAARYQLMVRTAHQMAPAVLK